jgi:hypothetical protein
MRNNPQRFELLGRPDDGRVLFEDVEVGSGPATSDASSLAGIDRVVMIADGVVRGETHPGQAEVLPFVPQRRQGRELRA